jgi:hypothetical protein
LERKGLSGFQSISKRLSSFLEESQSCPECHKREEEEMKKGLKLLGIHLLVIFLYLLLSPQSSIGQTGNEASDRFTYLIENGARMIRENEFEKILDMIGELPSKKKGDFRVKALESSAYLKGYVVTKNKVYAKKWQVSYKSLIYSTDKSATPILIEVLRDDNLYVRAFTAKALGFIGDKRALDELKKVAEKDKSSRVRSRAKWAYEQISGNKISKEGLDDEIK